MVNKKETGVTGTIQLVIASFPGRRRRDNIRVYSKNVRRTDLYRRGDLRGRATGASTVAAHDDKTKIIIIII